MLDTLRAWMDDDAVQRFVHAGIAILLTLILVRIVQRVVRRSALDEHARYHVRKFVGLAGWIAIGLFIAGTFSGQLNSLTVAFGVAGAGIAFALQEVILSFAGWIAISTGGFFRIGDRIQVAGITGDVIDIGVLRTTLMEAGAWVDGDQYSGRIVWIGNSLVFKDPIYNHSGPLPFLWDEVKVNVRLGSDREYVREQLLACARKVTEKTTADATNEWKQFRQTYPAADPRLEPTVMLRITDDGLSYTLRYVAPVRRRRVTQDQIFEEIATSAEGSGGRFRLFADTGS